MLDVKKSYFFKQKGCTKLITVNSDVKFCLTELDLRRLIMMAPDGHSEQEAQIAHLALPDF